MYYRKLKKGSSTYTPKGGRYGFGLKRKKGKGIWKTVKKYGAIGGKHLWHGVKKTVKDNFRLQELAENLAHHTIESLFKNNFSPGEKRKHPQKSKIPIRIQKGSGMNNLHSKLFLSKHFNQLKLYIRQHAQDGYATCFGT